MLCSKGHSQSLLVPMCRDAAVCGSLVQGTTKGVTETVKTCSCQLAFKCEAGIRPLDCRLGMRSYMQATEVRLG